MQTVGVTETRARFRELVEQVRCGSEPVQITKYGKPTAVLVSLDRLAEIVRWQKQLQAPFGAESDKGD